MNPNNKSNPIIGNLLLTGLFLLLLVAAVYSYKSIDWQVLQKMEEQPLNLPTPIPSQNLTATPSSESSQVNE